VFLSLPILAMNRKERKHGQHDEQIGAPVWVKNAVNVALSQQVRKNKKKESIVLCSMRIAERFKVLSVGGEGEEKKRQQNNKKDEEYFNRLDKVRWQKKKDEAIHPARFFLFCFALYDVKV
jgi:hypothetical protein